MFRQLLGNASSSRFIGVPIAILTLMVAMSFAVAEQAKKPVDGSAKEPIAAQSKDALKPFLGFFKNDSMTITIRQGRGKAFGSFTRNNTTTDFDATLDDSKLIGTFYHQGEPFKFIATVSGDTLGFKSGLSTIELTRSFDQSLILGTYEANGIEFTVRRKSTQYAGSLKTKEGTFTYTARLNGTTLKGTMLIQGIPSQLVANYEKDSFVVNLGVDSLKLTRTRSGSVFSGNAQVNTKREEVVIADAPGLIETSVILSPNNQRLAYLVKKDNRHRLMLDGKLIETATSVSRMRFSYNSKRFAFMETSDGEEWRLNVDQQKGKPYQAIGHGSQLFSPNSSRFAYAGLHDNQWHLVVDGNEVKTFDQIRSINFSVLGKHYACVAKKGGQEYIIINGKQSLGFDRVIFGRVLFSSNEERTAFIATRGSKVIPVIDGKEEPSYTAISRLAFSPDSQLVALIAEIKGKQHLVVDGKVGPGYDRLDHIRFNAKGDELACVARNDGKSFMVVNGVAGENQYIAMGPAVFSNDNKRMAYIAEVAADDLGAGKKMMRVVVDGNPGKRYEAIRNLQFSPDGQRVSYLTTNSQGTWRLVVDGGESRLYDSPPAALAFSRSGGHFAFVGRRLGEKFIVVDGVEGKAVTAKFLPASRLSFDGPNKLSTVLRADSKLIRLEIEILK